MASVIGLAPIRPDLKGRLRELLCIHGWQGLRPVRSQTVGGRTCLSDVPKNSLKRPWIPLAHKPPPPFTRRAACLHQRTKILMVPRLIACSPIIVKGTLRELPDFWLRAGEQIWRGRRVRDATLVASNRLTHDMQNSDPPFIGYSFHKLKLNEVVVRGGNAPPSSAYQAGALLLSYRTK